MTLCAWVVAAATPIKPAMARVFVNELLIFMMVFVFVMLRLTRLFGPTRRNTTQLPARRLDWLPMSSAPFRLKRGKWFEVFFAAHLDTVLDPVRQNRSVGVLAGGFGRRPAARIQCHGGASQRDAAGTRSRDGCATRTMSRCTLFTAGDNSCVDYSRFSPLAGLVNPAN